MEDHTPALEATAAWVQGTKHAAQLHAQQYADALQVSAAQLAALQLEQQRQAARRAQRQQRAQRPERHDSTEVQTHRNALYVPSGAADHEAALAEALLQQQHQQQKRRPQTQTLSAGEQLQQRLVRQYARTPAPQSLDRPVAGGRGAENGTAAAYGRAAAVGSPPRSAHVGHTAPRFVTERTGPWHPRTPEQPTTLWAPQAAPLAGGWAQPHHPGAAGCDDLHGAARLHWELQGCAFPQ